MMVLPVSAAETDWYAGVATDEGIFVRGVAEKAGVTRAAARGTIR